MLKTPDPPTRDALVKELSVVREKGLLPIADLALPALESASRIAAGSPTIEPDVLITTTLRRAVVRLGGGSFGEAAALLFGLDQETFALTGGVRRTKAAEAMGCSVKTFLRKHEKPMLHQIATQILILCTEQGVRDTREQLEGHHPADSGMALHWIEMFQAYYRLWSPIYGLGADLTAARSTLFELPRPYDRRHGTHGPDDPGYSQEDQAEGYASFALYHYAFFEWELRTFRTRYGGLWMLSDAEAEKDAADSVYLIYWHIQPLNERDQSFLRTVIDETPNRELEGFLGRLASTELGERTRREWWDWVETCDCTWTPDTTSENEYFPIHSNHAGINEACQVHKVIESCGRYCELIDHDWRKIADWYRLNDEVRKGVSADRLYTEWRSTPSGGDYRAPDHNRE